MLARLARSHTVLIFERELPFVPTDGSNRWRHWQRAALLPGLRLTPYIVDWGAGMVEALSRVGGDVNDATAGHTAAHGSDREP